MLAELTYHDKFICPRGYERRNCKPRAGYSYVTTSRFEEFCFALPLGRYFVTGEFNVPQLVTRTRGRFTYTDARAVPNSAPAPRTVEV